LIVASARRNAARQQAAVKQLVSMVVSDPAHGEANRRRVTGWLDAWSPQVDGAAVALSAVFDLPGIEAPSATDALRSVRAGFEAVRAELAV
jgi:hypothetical protein